MKKILLSCMLVFLLPACTAGPDDFKQGDQHIVAFEEDVAYCETRAFKKADSHSMPGFAGFEMTTINYNDIFKNCMRSLGYEEKQGYSPY